MDLTNVSVCSSDFFHPHIKYTGTEGVSHLGLRGYENFDLVFKQFKRVKSLSIETLGPNRVRLLTATLTKLKEQDPSSWCQLRRFDVDLYEEGLDDGPAETLLTDDEKDKFAALLAHSNIDEIEFYPGKMKCSADHLFDEPIFVTADMSVAEYILYATKKERKILATKQ